MDFKDKLAEYIELLNCSAKDLSESSGLSAATISRYQSGERVPKADSENFLNLVNGIVRISESKGITDFTLQSVSDALAPFAKGNEIDAENLRINFSLLLDALHISIADISKFLTYDPSYISRIKNGKRRPTDPQEFASGVADFVVRRYQNNSQKATVADLIGCSPDEFTTYTDYRSLLVKWLSGESKKIPVPKIL